MNKEKISLLVKEVADIEDIKDDEPLISGGILDSFSVLILISRLESDFKIRLEMSQLDIKKIDSVNLIYSTIKKIIKELFFNFDK